MSFVNCFFRRVSIGRVTIFGRARWIVSGGEVGITREVEDRGAEEEFCAWRMEVMMSEVSDSSRVR